MRGAILAHSGEALAERLAFEALTPRDRDCVIEFLKTLQVLPQDTAGLVVDENRAPKVWPPNRVVSITRDAGLLKIKWQGSTALYQVQRVYQLQQKGSLTDGNWQDVGSPTLAAQTEQLIQGDTGFYRVLLLGE